MRVKKTNTDKLLQKIGLLIVYAWVLLAVGFFVLTAWDPTYLESAENYVSILAIIGGPALLIVTKIIETWTIEKQTELQDYETQATHERAMNDILTRHFADMERNPQTIQSPAVENSSGSISTQVSSLRAQIKMLQKDLDNLK
jgi:polyhydroxyalkanoate synthesis regulator protein